ncbi:nuclear pore complex protein Nup107 [Marchantia polymorpha subsp. ruderalis]|uniref:Nuclear pore complex protein n=2 Tax=Marchantia polymorpha TaxID=3197 RepID=A0AAF6B3Y2_MARPO|nr:hypothetical protein MARPO_0024s0112 [Marchantia polymorpha]BBN06716.1 hypothetical protein Mp_3g23360 [Marchantia polymorpha subsp. ruderalis]|eukprot:PTQ43614.1 hypothetical protein MARPO_0024s0112 [Marchantia polymorpha]
MSGGVGSPPARDTLQSHDSSPQDTPDSGGRQQFRRYRKRRSSIGLFSGADEVKGPLPFGGGFGSPTGERYASPQSLPDASPWERWDSGGEDLKTPIPRKLFGTGEGREVGDLTEGLNVPISHARTPTTREQQRRVTLTATPISSPIILKTVKKEDQLEVTDSAEESFARFAGILDATFQGHFSFPELMLQYEAVCRDLVDLVREEASETHRVTEDRLMRQKALMLHGEAASWSLLWYLFGKSSEEMYLDDDDDTPVTSEEEACEFIASDQNAQLCSRIVQWLETLASKELDYEKKHKGWYAGSYAQKLGVWRHTQSAIRKKTGGIVQHLDPDAPSREQAQLHSEDQKLEESLLEDVWKLLLAGRLEEAQDLCRSAGQAWRAASLGGCGELGPSPTVEAWKRKSRDWSPNAYGRGRDRSLKAVELESGSGHQRRLWKWACFAASNNIGDGPHESKYEAAIFASQCGNVKRMLPVCFTWEAACWAMVRSWLDVEVDLQLSSASILKSPQEINDESTGGPELWPQPVVYQQPRDLHSLFQKLLTGDLVNEAVRRSCKEQQRLVQMDLMLGDITHLLELLRTWIAPSQDTRDSSRPHGHPQMIRFGAHLVLVLRYILNDEMKEQFKEKLWLIGDLILNTYAIFLFTQRKEELVGVYASQLAPHLCVELYVQMIELRENESVPVKYKIFKSAIEYLPFISEDGTKGSFSDIISRVLSKSRDIKSDSRPLAKVEISGQRLQTVRKAHAVQWLCFLPPPSLSSVEVLRAELLARALEYSNVLFREYSLSCLWRTPEMPVGAHVLLGHLAEPLNQPTDALLSLDQLRVQENLQEFEEWREYYACDALYRNWLKIEQGNSVVPSDELSSDEKERAATAAQQALDAASSLLQRNHGMWLAGVDDVAEDDLAPDWIELQCTGMLSSSSGSSLVPDASVCTALVDALYNCGAIQGVQRQLTVDVTVNGKDHSLVDILLRCLPVKGDGLGSNTDYDGGLLASIIAYAVKGELPHFRAGIVLEVLRLDAWYISGDGIQQVQAGYIVQGLCRRCCLPELILRSMQVKAALAAASVEVDDEDCDVLELVASKEYELYQLFSQRQLQELLQFERRARIYSLEVLEASGFFSDTSVPLQNMQET